MGVCAESEAACHLRFYGPIGAAVDIVVKRSFERERERALASPTIDISQDFTPVGELASSVFFPKPSLKGGIISSRVFVAGPSKVKRRGSLKGWPFL